MKVIFSMPAGGTRTVHICCGECDVVEIPEDAKTMRSLRQHFTSDRIFFDAELFEHLDISDWARYMKSEMAIISERPDFIEYTSKETRLESFDNWPKSMKQTPEQLSDAGFFYTGKADRVICFWCGIGLSCWEEDDDAWEQHALHQCNCKYLQKKKGEDYITSVKVKFAVDEPDLSTLSLNN